MKVQVDRSDPLNGKADCVTLERAIDHKQVRVRVAYGDQSGLSVTFRKQDLIDALKAL